MAGLTLANAQAKLTEWLNADTAVSKNQAHSIAGRSVSKADAKEIRDNIVFWDKQVKRLTRGGIRMRGARPTYAR